MKEYIKKNLFNMLSMVVSAGLLLYFCISNDGVKDLVRNSDKLDPLWLVIACGCMIVFWLLESGVLHMLISRIHQQNRFGNSVRVSMIGQLYSAITPFSTGGQPMQVYQMTKYGIDAGSSASVLALKSIIYQVGLTGFSMVSIVMYFGFFSSQINHFGILIAFGLGINILVILTMITFSYNPRLTQRIMGFGVGLLHRIKLVKDKEVTMEKATTQLKHFHDGTQLFARSKGIYIMAILLTVAQFVFYFSIPYCIYRCFNLSGAALVAMMCAQSMVSMVSAFIPLPGGSGGAEGSFYILFKLFFDSASIMPAVLLWRVITYYSCILVGGITAAIGDRKKRNGMPADNT